VTDNSVSIFCSLLQRGKIVYIDVENAELFINAIKSGWRVLTLPMTYLHSHTGILSHEQSQFCPAVQLALNEL
jgi:hypothetical protein